MKREYRIIGAYDSETTNFISKEGIYAYPVLHQLGLLDVPIIEVDSSNVEQHCHIELYRHAVDLYAKLDELVNSNNDFVPVICCHNLSFDMYALSAYLDRCDNVKVLAKSCRKPITFTICDDKNQPRLVLWDTLGFSQQSLSRMGEDCGYLKAVGEWDYTLIRTPETPLSDQEIDYACKDVFALLAWLGWWVRRNPDIEPSKLGLNVVTKTGIVREKKRVLFDGLRGKSCKYNVGRYWMYLNRTQAPKTDDELYTMVASTRGGFTFCASKHASYPYNLSGSGCKAYGYDATSMHPAQMVSHLYPVDFHAANTKTLENVFFYIAKRNIGDLLRSWHKPFAVACYACFEFENIRPKSNSLYKEQGIFPLASARFQNIDYEINEDNQDAQEFNAQGYKDKAVNPVFKFGKLESADSCKVYLTELGIWEVSQSYDFDNVKPISGYISTRFVKPSDMSVLAVMHFYNSKNVFKRAREEYYEKGTISNSNDLISAGIPDAIVKGMLAGTLSDIEVDSCYMGLKASLNSLFGIEATNEYRRDTVLNGNGIAYVGDFGIVNKPKNPKAWYQYGQRIVGWSRIAQHVIMQLANPYIIDIVNGDTDSVKFIMPESCKSTLDRRLSIYSRAIDNAKKKVCSRVKKCYPGHFDRLDYIGHYVCEFETSRICASWNKAYCIQDIDKRDGRMRFDITLAGIPAKRGLNQLADKLYDEGYSFEYICNRFLGYNVTVSYDLINLHARSFPDWGDIVSEFVEDYSGKMSHVVEPAALALFPMSKTLNNTRNSDNYGNCLQAVANNPDVSTDPILIYKGGIIENEMG